MNMITLYYFIMKYVKNIKINNAIIVILLTINLTILILTLIKGISEHKKIDTPKTNKLLKFVEAQISMNNRYTTYVPDTIYVFNEKNKKIYLNSIIEKNSLLFYFSELSCQTCVDEALITILKKLKNKNNLIILTQYDDSQYRIFLKRKYNIKNTFYNIRNSNFLKLHRNFNMQTPFICEISNHLLYNYILPSPEMNMALDKYLSIVSKE